MAIENNRGDQGGAGGTSGAGAEGTASAASGAGPAEDTSRFPVLARYFLWADRPAAVQRLIIGLAIVCGVLFILDLFIHRHTEVPGEGFPGFYAIVGFVSFTLIVLGAKQLRTVIMRDESFYAPYGVDAESYPDAGTGRLTLDGESVAPRANGAASSRVSGSAPGSAKANEASRGRP